MHPVHQYLKTLAEIHSTGGATAETSYYIALETLLNEVGSKLKVKVRAVSQLANTGAGSPDFGLYTASQFQRAKDNRPIQGTPPERGVIEVKPWKDDSFVTAQTEQVSKYWNRYGLVLVTNYRDFVLIGRDESGRPVRLETHRLAESERDFRALLTQPGKAADAGANACSNFCAASCSTKPPSPIPRTLPGSWLPMPARRATEWRPRRTIWPSARSSRPSRMLWA